MRSFVAVLVVSSLVLSACGNSSANPRNWFGKKRAPSSVQTADTPTNTNPLIPERQRVGLLKSIRKKAPYQGLPVDQITGLVLEPTSGGAVVSVTAQSLQQGAHDVRLTSDSKYEPVDGVLTLTLKAVQPTNTPQGPERTRVIRAAHYLSRGDLDKIRQIRVVGARNSKTLSP